MTGKKIYLVQQESNVDAEILFNVVPCSTLDKAKEVLEEEKNTILKESHHFSNLTNDDLNELEIKENEDGTYWFINDPYDDYYEEIKIIEKEIA
jgi:hypothetical protein